VVRIADRLRARNLAGVHVEVVENKHRKLAIELVRNALDRNRNGSLEAEECSSARVILYGQSMGGAAVQKAARELGALGVPVRLTVQIDSVGVGDANVPRNVLRAANLYQSNGLLIRGEKELRPEDPARTEILGNFRYDYSQTKIPLPRTEHVKWYKRLFWISHTQMEFDPAVWSKTEELILSELRSPKKENE
jgi:pimeloyl-ACP methyl ester carboxylesterase